MCLGIPARIISVGLSDQFSKPAILKRADGTEMTADLAMVPKAEPGDYVVTHSGFAVSLLTSEEALQAIGLLDEMKAGENSKTSE